MPDTSVRPPWGYGAFVCLAEHAGVVVLDDGPHVWLDAVGVGADYGWRGRHSTTTVTRRGTFSRLAHSRAAWGTLISHIAMDDVEVLRAVAEAR